MTEAEWFAATDPTPMLDFLRGQASDRKLRLFACACCRSVWTNAWPLASRRVVQAAESFADGLGTEKDLTVARLAAGLAVSETVDYGHVWKWGEAGDEIERRLTIAALTGGPVAHAVPCVAVAATRPPVRSVPIVSDRTSHSCLKFRGFFADAAVPERLGTSAAAL